MISRCVLLFFIPIPCHKSRLSHVNVFLHHYERQLKIVVEQEAGKKIRLEKIIIKRQRNKNLKMASFWQYLTVQIVLIEKKTSLINVFPELLKIMAKKT